MTRAELQSRIDGNERVIELGETTFDVDEPVIVPAGRAPLTIRGKGKEGTVVRAGAGFLNSEGVTVRLHDLTVIAQVPHTGMVMELAGGGTGIERSGVCHCGQSMDGHSVYDNHSALEMERACESCTAALKKRLATAAEVIEACEKAIAGRKKLFGPQPTKLDAALIWRAQDDVLEAWQDAALALCARWKEVNGA